MTWWQSLLIALIPALITAIVSGLFSYFLAIKKSKKDIEQLAEKHKQEMETLREQHKLEIEKIQFQQEHEKKMKEQDVGAKIGESIVASLMGGIMGSDKMQQKIDEFNQKTFANSSEKKPYKPIVISDEGLELIEFISVDCTASDGEWHSDCEIKIDKNGYVILNGTKTKQFWDGSIRCAKKPLRLKIRNICGDESVWEL